MPKITDKKLLKEQSFITKCIFKGMSNEEIARELKYSVSTISNRTTSLFKKYNAKTRFEFILGIIGEIITNHKATIYRAKNEIKDLKEKVYSIETLLTNIVTSQSNKQKHKKWLKNAEEYLRS